MISCFGDAVSVPLRAGNNVFVLSAGFDDLASISLDVDDMVSLLDMV